MDFQNKKAIYLQIADYVCEKILLNLWKEKDKIPSVRELAVSLEVNPNTVVRTYAFLEENKIISMQRGIGYFVSEGGFLAAMELKKEEFLTEDLPHVFKTMDLLGVDIKNISKLYSSCGRHPRECGDPDHKRSKS